MQVWFVFVLLSVLAFVFVVSVSAFVFVFAVESVFVVAVPVIDPVVLLVSVHQAVSLQIVSLSLCFAAVSVFLLLFSKAEHQRERYSEERQTVRYSQK